MATDALSDVLKAVRLTGAAFFDVVACAPWVAEQPTREMVLPKILPGAGHLISYHVVTDGSCYAAKLGEEAVLRDGLPGYRDYTVRVRYRLIPGIW